MSVGEVAAAGNRSSGGDGVRAADTQRFSLLDRLRQLSSMWRVHATGAALSFGLNFGSKGCEIWVGEFVAELGQPQLKRSIYFATTSGKIAGDVVNMALTRRLGRLRCLQLGYLGAAVCTLGFAAPGVGAPLLLLLGFSQGLYTDLCWCNLYIYLTERFPSTVRNTGFGISMGCGRGGGVLSSALGGVLQSNRQAAFVAFGLSFAVSGGVACLPRVETARRALVDSVVDGKQAGHEAA